VGLPLAEGPFYMKKQQERKECKMKKSLVIWLTAAAMFVYFRMFSHDAGLKLIPLRRRTDFSRQRFHSNRHAGQNA
jgi:hypothetical protein